jgi:hypothetical protein
MGHVCQLIDFLNGDGVNLVVQIHTRFVLSVALDDIHQLIDSGDFFSCQHIGNQDFVLARED